MCLVLCCCRENEASLSTLTDMQHQLKAVEMLIIHSEVSDRLGLELFPLIKLVE